MTSGPGRGAVAQWLESCRIDPPAVVFSTKEPQMTPSDSVVVTISTDVFVNVPHVLVLPNKLLVGNIASIIDIIEH